MIKVDFRTETKSLSLVFQNILEQSGPDIAKEIFSKSEILLVWLEYLVQSESTGVCDGFLDGFRASIVETIACGVSGLVRPALFSMRSQIDIILSWIYFKDHSIEWAKVESSGDGFALKGMILDYLKFYIPNYESRFTQLLAKKNKDRERSL